MSITEYEFESKSQALTNLYLSALIGPPKQVYTYDTDPLVTQDMAATDELDYLKQVREEAIREAASAMTALGYRFEHGISVS